MLLFHGAECRHCPTGVFFGHIITAVMCYDPAGRHNSRVQRMVSSKFTSVILQDFRATRTITHSSLLSRNNDEKSAMHAPINQGCKGSEFSMRRPESVWKRNACKSKTPLQSLVNGWQRNGDCRVRLILETWEERPVPSLLIHALRELFNVASITKFRRTCI